MATLNEKLKISAGSATLFAFINMAETYGLTDQYLPIDTWNPVTQCPTMMGQLLHAVVFFLITYATMRDPTVDNNTKIRHSLYGTLIFFFISSPAMYSLTSSILGPVIATPDGCPTLMGVLLHAVVYCAVLVGVMYL